MAGQKLPTFLILGLIIVAGALTFALREDPMRSGEAAEEEPMRTVRVAGAPIAVWVADTPDTRRRGLSGYAELPENHGMLFIFDTSDTYGIWMKDMNFSIDVLWMNAGGVIVDMREGMAPDTYPEIFTPRTPAQYVLELPAGFAEMHRVSVGDRVEL